MQYCRDDMSRSSTTTSFHIPSHCFSLILLTVEVVNSEVVTTSLYEGGFATMRTYLHTHTHTHLNVLWLLGQQQ